MKHTLIITLLLLASSAEASTLHQLGSEWSRLNAACRGGPGDDQSTLKACDDREAIMKRICTGGFPPNAFFADHIRVKTLCAD